MRLDFLRGTLGVVVSDEMLARDDSRLAVGRN
jgi:hypothetical protein